MRWQSLQEEPVMCPAREIGPEILHKLAFREILEPGAQAHPQSGKL